MNAILAALLGGIGGGTVSLFGQVWLESLKQRHEFRRNRLVALQNCVFLIDALFAYGERLEAKLDEDLWEHARKNNSWSGVFFPDHMQNDFTHLARVIIGEPDPRKAFAACSVGSLRALRMECLKLIKSHHQVSRRTLKRWFGLGD